MRDVSGKPRHSAFVGESEEFKRRERDLQKMRDELKALQRRIAEAKKSAPRQKPKQGPKQSDSASE